MSGEKEVTASALRCILVHLKAMSDNILAKSMKEIMLEDLEQRYSLPQVSEILDLCSFLDSRFKIRYLEDKDNTISSVTEECLTASSYEEEHHPSDNSVQIEADHPPPLKKYKGLSALLKNIDKEHNERESIDITPEVRIKNEITSYVEFPTADSEMNLLDWWKAECKRFPVLSRLAIKYLCICGTSVPSERIFSIGGYTVNEYHKL